MENILAVFAASFCTISFIPQITLIRRTKELKLSRGFLMLYFVGVCGWLSFGIYTKSYLLDVASFLQLLFVATIYAQNRRLSYAR